MYCIIAAASLTLSAPLKFDYFIVLKIMLVTFQNHFLSLIQVRLFAAYCEKMLSTWRRYLWRRMCGVRQFQKFYTMLTFYHRTLCTTSRLNLIFWLPKVSIKICGLEKFINYLIMLDCGKHFQIVNNCMPSFAAIQGWIITSAGAVSALL